MQDLPIDLARTGAYTKVERLLAVVAIIFLELITTFSNEYPCM